VDVLTLAAVERQQPGAAPAALVAAWLAAELDRDPPARVSVHTEDLVIVSGRQVGSRLAHVLGEDRFRGWSTAASYDASSSGEPVQKI